MPITGNTNYNDIQDKQYINMETDKQQQIIDELNKQNIPFSALYDNEKITITFSKSNFEKVNDALNSLNREQQPTQTEPEQKNSFSEMAKQIRKQAILDILRMQEDPDFRKKFFEENQIDFQSQKNSEPTVQSSEQTESVTEISNETTETQSTEMISKTSFDIQQLDTSKDSYKLLPIIDTKVQNQQQKIDTLTFKRDTAMDKISMHKARIDSLNEKAERLTTTNQMLQELINNKMTPAFVKSAAQNVIKTNQVKIDKINNEKIPNCQAKIDKQQNKIEKFDRRINLAQCKINRYTSFNNVITSFSLINNSDRRKQFAAAMDSLHKSSIDLYNAKIDISTDKIRTLTAKYENSNDITIKSVVHKSLTRQKNIRQKCINKRNNLIGVIIPISKQSEKVQDNALKHTEEVLNNKLGEENVTVAEAADIIAVAPLPALPEHSFTEPDPTQDINRMLPEIADIMKVSVSELESKPTDIKQMLVLDYTNNFDSTLEDIQESLSSIINPNVSVDSDLEKAKSEQSVNSSHNAEPIEKNQNDSAVQAKSEQEQAQKKINYLKSTEEAVEGNYDMIDGIINNTPPPKEPEKESENELPATISMSLLMSNAAIADEIYSEQRQDRTDKSKQPPEIG